MTDFRYFSTVLAEHQLSLSYVTYILNIRRAKTWNKRCGGGVPQPRSGKNFVDVPQELRTKLLWPCVAC
jgi:hypothetical protein